MNGSLGAYAPQGIALLLGGMLASLGPTFWARSKRGSARLLKLGTGPLAAGLTVAALAGVAGAVVIARSIVSVGASDPSAIAIWQLLLLGVCVGLPMSLPGVIAGRSEARRREREGKKWRDRVPTKDDRRAYAVDLVRQIQEVSPRPRDLSAKIAGDGGTVLRFEGEIAATEGEKLTAALRHDLKEIGFKRVEGADGAKEWWSRV